VGRIRPHPSYGGRLPGLAGRTVKLTRSLTRRWGRRPGGAARGLRRKSVARGGRSGRRRGRGPEVVGAAAGGRAPSLRPLCGGPSKARGTRSSGARLPPSGFSHRAGDPGPQRQAPPWKRPRPGAWTGELSRSSSTSSSGSSTSTGSSSGSSSSSASSRSGSSSTSRSSSSSSSSGSPSPSRRRHDNRRRSRSKSKPPKRDEKERKRRSPSPKPTKVHIGRLTRNVTKDHIMEIFSTYGKIKMIDMPVERMHPHLSKGYAYVEFENPDEAEKALKHMDGGQIDGQEITATAVLAPWPRPPPRRFSPPRRMLPPPPMWRRSPPRMRRRSRSPRRRSPVRRRSRSPGRRRHRSRSSSNSSR
uniref:RNA-binding protein with serine-rich domain 1 n=1 Tax=Equus caballus TaxID=9796 RepID=A0A9L0TJS1_HORSE